MHPVLSVQDELHERKKKKDFPKEINVFNKYMHFLFSLSLSWGVEFLVLV